MPPGAETPNGTSSSPTGIIADARREATEIVREAIGDDELRRERAVGAALDDDAAVAYALDAIVAALSATRP